MIINSDILRLPNEDSNLSQHLQTPTYIHVWPINTRFYNGIEQAPTMIIGPGYEYILC